MDNDHSYQQQHRSLSPLVIILSSDDEDDNDKQIKNIQNKEENLTLTDNMEISLIKEEEKEKESSIKPMIPYSTSLINTTTTMNSPFINDYIPKTITTHNQARLTLLPAFPTSIYNSHTTLLLANVPVHLLSNEQLFPRYQMQWNEQSTCKIWINSDSTIPSVLRNYFEMNYELLSNRLNIHWSILDYNYARLDNCLQLFANERIHRLQESPSTIRLLDEEKPIAMEFFLQMDVDIFYMKTFHHRNVQPTDINKDLFCIVEPELRFSFKSCRYPNCEICTCSKHITHRSQLAVRFEENGLFQFINGYQTVLNAPATCITNGIIYVLKCPCGEFEYVGETGNNLRYTLHRHRINGNRIMHHFLIGEPKQNYHISNNHVANELNRKSSMHLYQHSTRCTVVMQMFLNCYPHYWIFVPMLRDLVQQHNMNFRQYEQTMTRSSISTTTIKSQENLEIESYIRNIPLPPIGYEFSQQQYHAQIEFFKNKKHQQLPNLLLDLYNASVIVVLPEKTSVVLRQFLTSLFITHGETKLNSIGNLLVNMNENSIYPHSSLSLRGNWCQNLIDRPPISL